MNVPDGAERATRRDEAHRLLAGTDHSISVGLEEYFKVRYYAFGNEARRVDSAVVPAAVDRATNISAALERALGDFRGLPLSGVVMLTDGTAPDSAYRCRYGYFQSTRPGARGSCAPR